MEDVDIQVVVWIEIRPDRAGEDQDQDGSHADQRQPMPDEAPNAPAKRAPLDRPRRRQHLS